MSDPDAGLPRTRWELASSSGYAQHFTDLIAAGADVEGEARLADALVGRGARILDAGSGIGRTGGALAARGHRVTAVEKDPALVALSRRHYPDLEVVESDLLGIDAQTVGAPFDLVVLVGNVMVLLAEDTEVRVLELLRGLLAPGGRVLVGFHPQDSPASTARRYPFEEFAADVASAGLVVQHRFGGYELADPHDGYCVAVLARAADR